MGVANSQNTRFLIYTPVDGKIQKKSGTTGSVSSYATPGTQGDNITMTVDLRREHHIFFQERSAAGDSRFRVQPMELGYLHQFWDL